jgi:hypothetical protein
MGQGFEHAVKGHDRGAWAIFSIISFSNAFIYLLPPSGALRPGLNRVTVQP